jgi:hypothetical protein
VHCAEEAQAIYPDYQDNPITGEAWLKDSFVA